MSALEQILRLPTWRRYAACRGRTSLFYSSDEMSERVAVLICEGCGVRSACLADALADEAVYGDPVGVRGGMRAAERRALIGRHCTDTAQTVSDKGVRMLTADDETPW